MKDLYLYTDGDKLFSRNPKNLSGTSTTNKNNNNINSNSNYAQMVFSEDKKLPIHLGICPTLSYDYSDNIFRGLNGKVIQIKHVESELYLTMSIKKKINKTLEDIFGDLNSRYVLN